MSMLQKAAQEFPAQRRIAAGRPHPPDGGLPEEAWRPRFLRRQRKVIVMHVEPSRTYPVARHRGFSRRRLPSRV
jgi:hypothetical protein